MTVLEFFDAREEELGDQADQRVERVDIADVEGPSSSPTLEDVIVNELAEAASGGEFIEVG